MESNFFVKHKKGIIKSFYAMIYFTLLILFLLILFYGQNLFSVQNEILDNYNYEIGETIKIILPDIDYDEAKIITPSSSLKIEENDGVVLFKPTEVGKYEISFYKNEEKIFSEEFFVILSNQDNFSYGNLPAENNIKEFNENETIIEERIEESQKIEKEFIEGLYHEDIEINKPVVWYVNKKVDESNEKIDLPTNAQNIKGYKVDNEKIPIPIKIDKNNVGNVFSRIISLNKNNGKIHTIMNDKGNIVIEYETIGPVVKEKDLDDLTKEVKVSSQNGVHYENVKAYTSINEITNNEDNILIYWKEENKYLDFNTSDLDRDGLFDFIEWSVPHLSEQTFEITLHNSSIFVFDFKSGNEYLIGDSIIFNFNRLGNYEIKITNPSGKELSRVGSNDRLIYNLDEEGEYNVLFIRGNERLEYKFYVIREIKKEIFQHEAEIGKGVLWTRIIKNNLIEFPYGENVFIKNSDNITINFEFIFINGTRYIQINDENYFGSILKYTTPPPVLTENFISTKQKNVVISSPEGIHYENVKAFTNLSEITTDSKAYRVYWKENNTYVDYNATDSDGNGLIDRIEWIVPHTSEQTFEIILITSAEHLNSNRNFIEDVYPYVKTRDGNFKEIPAGNFVRVTFEKNLTSINDISIYSKSSSTNASVEVYEKDSNIKIVNFGTISSDDLYKIFLTNLDGSADTFDLKVTGGNVEFDYIVDPTVIYIYNYSGVNATNGSHKAWNVDLDAWPPDDGIGTINGNTNTFTELNEVNYTNIRTSDNNRNIVPDPGPGDEPMFQLRMRINESENTISQLGFHFEGFPGTAGNLYIYLYNDSAGSWSTTALSSAAFGTSDQVLTATLSNQITDFINGSGDLVWGVFSDSSSENLNVDFVQVNVTVTDNTVPLITILSPPNQNLTSTTVNFNVTLNEVGSWCGLSLDGDSNITMTKNNNTNFGYVNSTMSTGFHSVRYACNDTLGNMNISSGDRQFGITLDSQPSIGRGFVQQIWTVGKNVIYNLNFSNNGSNSGNYEINITNMSGASYVSLNQSIFTNVSNQSTAYFQLNLSSSIQGVYNISLNVSSTTENKKDGIIFDTTFLPVYGISLNNVSSIFVTPLDFNKVVVVWCDDSEDDISVGVFDTTGNLLHSIQDIDTSAGSCAANSAGHSVSVSAFDSNRFVVGWYDSVDLDVTYKIYNSSLSNLSGEIDVDTDVTNSLSVSTSVLNSTSFVIGWFDDTDNSVRAGIYSNTGTTITSPFDIDSSVGSSWSMGVSAINSTAFAIAYFDDSGSGGGINDIYFTVFNTGGTAITSAVQVDSNAGNSRSVSISTINDSTIVVDWADAIGNSKSFIIYQPNGAIKVNQVDYDTDAIGGEDTKVSAVSLNTFVLSWFDPNTDIGTFTQTYYNNGTALSSQVTVGPSSQQFNDVASEEYATQIQLCDNTYAVAFSNTTGAFLRTYYSNGTIWNGNCIITVPQILNLNVSNIQITSAQVNWSTDIESNSTINYGLSMALGTLQSSNTPSIYHVYELTSLSGSTTYFFNVTSCKDGICNTTGTHNFTTSTSDVISPIVNLVWPFNNSNITNGYDFYYVFNVSDSSNILSCALFIDGTYTQNRTGISKNINETFYHYLRNGNYNWSVSCTDIYGNVGFSQNRTIGINYTDISFGRRLYETFNSGYTTGLTALIRLNNSQDGQIHSVTFDVGPSSLVNIVNASTQVMGANGAIIPSGSIVDFSTSFSAAHANVETTWKIYIQNNSGSTLLCQNGDDNSAGTPTAGTITGQNTTCISTDVRLRQSDRLLYVINLFNTHASSVRTINHSWDTPTSSFIDLNISVEGFLTVNLTYPLSDPNLLTGQTFTASCDVACSVGNCRNTQVYVQYNTSTLDWTNIGASGNLILGGGETNPHNLGNITSNSVITNFTLQANTDSVNNLRCIAVSSYDGINGTQIRQITITASQNTPNIQLTNPPTDTYQNTSTIVLYYNASDTNNNIANTTLIINGLRNQTNSSSVPNGVINNFTLTLPDGNYNWSVNVSDTTNLENFTSQRTFTIDTQGPNITLYNPFNNESFATSLIVFNFSVNDNLDPVLVCDLIIDGTVSENDFNVNNGSFSSFTKTLTAGYHSWNVTCIDNPGTEIRSETRNFTITETPPMVFLITGNNTFSNTGNITLQYNATDNAGFLNASLNLNGQINQSNQTTIVNHAINEFNLTGLNEGVYLWTVNVTDTGYNNISNITFRTFTVDLRSPNVSLYAPANGTKLNSSTVNVNFTVIDTMDTSLTCNVSYDSTTTSNFAATNSSVTNQQITNLVDGVHYWNATCSDDAGNYNRTQSWWFNVSEYPSITLNTPNASFFNTTTFYLNYTPRDNTNISLCDIYLDGTFNQTYNNPVNNAMNNFTMSNVNQGLHSWYVSCVDGVNLRNNSEARYFTVDTNGLTVNLIWPPNGTQIFNSNVVFSFNATDNIDPVLGCNITVNSVIVNASTANSGEISNKSVLFGTGGLKIWNVTCFDDSQNSFTSETRNFTLAFAPSIALNSPANNTFTNLTNQTFFYDVADDNNNLANATLIINGERNITNQSALINEGTNNFTIILQDGVYTWTVNVSDTTNLEATDTSIRTITIDTIKPTIRLNYPPNVTTLSTNNVTINITVYDNLDNLLSCNININDNPDISTNISTIGDNVNYLTKSDGGYLWNVDCQDESRNLNTSVLWNFTVEAPPLVTSLDPTMGEIINYTNLTFVYLPNDAIGIVNCSLIIDGIENSSSGTITSNVNNSFNVQNFVEGHHNWSAFCVDAFPDFNVGRSNVTNFTVDVSPPTIQLNSPLNNTNVLRNVTINFSAWDNLDADLNLTCDLYIDNSLNLSNIIVYNGSSIQRNILGHSLGGHSWNVSCIDDATNRNWSVKWDYNVTLPDFEINTSLIRFNSTNPSENESVLVNATIYNLGNVSVNNLIVQFFDGAPGTIGAYQIGTNQTISTLNGLSSTLLNFTWQADTGTSYIVVIIDPQYGTNGSIEEWNESNNYANSSTTVGAWQFVYGNVNSYSFFELATNLNKSLIRWDAINFSDGNLFVTDSESVITWTRLRAIGRNSSNSVVLDDYVQIDNLLNMTNFSDSVSVLFANGTGASLRTDNYTVFNFNSVLNVPEANSTNNTNFETGIFWDSSDDNTTSGQFDNINKEDLVFGAKFNKNKVGSYGVYDYEMRIPAKLREYRTTDISQVVFYAEIS